MLSILTNRKFKFNWKQQNFQWCLRDIFDDFVLWPCDLDLWPFDFDIVSYTVPHMPDLHTNFDYPTTIGYWVMNYWIWSYGGTVTVQCACATSRDLYLGGQLVHILKIPHPNLPIHFVTFRALRHRLSHVICENSVYPIVKATKFTAHAHDLCIGVPQNHT